MVAFACSESAQNPENSVLLPTAYVPLLAHPVLALLWTVLCTPVALRHTPAMAADHHHLVVYRCTWRITAHVATREVALALLVPIHAELLNPRIEMSPFAW